MAVEQRVLKQQAGGFAQQCAGFPALLGQNTGRI